MRSAFSFQKKGCVKRYVHKHQRLEIRQNPYAGTQVEKFASQLRLDGLGVNNVEPNIPIQGKLYFNNYTTLFCWCYRQNFCPDYSYQIQGYKTKLSEVTPERIFAFFEGYGNFLGCCYWTYCCCPPKYFVVDNSQNQRAQFLGSCCLLPCCSYLNISTPGRLNVFKIEPIWSCCYCLYPKWRISDSLGNEVGSIQQICHFCDRQIDIAFSSSIQSHDKIVLMSAIPVLP